MWLWRMLITNVSSYFNGMVPVQHTTSSHKLQISSELLGRITESERLLVEKLFHLRIAALSTHPQTTVKVSVQKVCWTFLTPKWQDSHCFWTVNLKKICISLYTLFICISRRVTPIAFITAIYRCHWLTLYVLLFILKNLFLVG